MSRCRMQWECIMMVERGKKIEQGCKREAMTKPTRTCHIQILSTLSLFVNSVETSWHQTADSPLPPHLSKYHPNNQSKQ